MKNMSKLIILSLTILLEACSPLGIVDAFKPNKGLKVSAQLGDSKNNVETGIGSIGDETKLSLSVEDSKIAEIVTTSGKYHLAAKDDITVNVYESNKWIVPSILLYLLGRPLIAYAVKIIRRKKNG